MTIPGGPRVEVVDVADLIPDERNANMGTERGTAMLEDSLRKYKAGRSILLDKRGRIIAGNKTHAKFGEIGGGRVVVVHTDGTSLVAVQRDDLDLDEPEARALAIADNRVGEVNLEWNSEALEELATGGFDFNGLFSGAELERILATSIAGDVPQNGGGKMVCPACGYEF